MGKKILKNRNLQAENQGSTAKNDIFPIWQPVGNSTHFIAKRLAKKLSSKENVVKTSHTGTLDPMAEGVIIVLANKNRHNKYEYAKWKKTYEFEMVLGVETDTQDGLGLITKHCNSDKKITNEHIDKLLESFKGNYKQTIPAYSTIKIKGKHLHWYARNNKLNEIKLPTREGEIFNIELISQNSLSCEKMVKNIVSRINKISGDLRQKEIIENWRYFNDQNYGNANLKKQNYTVFKIKVTISKGLYIRALSQDISKKLNTCAFTYSIVRTQNGIYTKDNSYKLSDLF